MKYEVLGRGHRINTKSGTRLALPGEIVDLPERVAASLVPWRLKPRPDLDKSAVQRAVEAGASYDVDESSAPSVDITPEAMKLAAEYGIEKSNVQGTGQGGRILKKDVTRLVDERGADSAISDGTAEIVTIPMQE